MENKTTKKLNKNHVLFLIYGVLSLSMIAVFWLLSGEAAKTYTHAILWLVLPFWGMVVAYMVAFDAAPKGLKRLIPIGLGLLLMMTEYLTFSLKAVVAKGELVIPSIGAFLLGFIAARFGFSFGKRDRKEREKEEKSKARRAARKARASAKKNAKNKPAISEKAVENSIVAEPEAEFASEIDNDENIDNLGSEEKPDSHNSEENVQASDFEYSDEEMTDESISEEKSDECIDEENEGQCISEENEDLVVAAEDNIENAQKEHLENEQPEEMAESTAECEVEPDAKPEAELGGENNDVKPDELESQQCDSDLENEKLDIEGEPSASDEKGESSEENCDHPVEDECEKGSGVEESFDESEATTGDEYIENDMEDDSEKMDTDDVAELSEEEQKTE